MNDKNKTTEIPESLKKYPLNITDVSRDDCTLNNSEDFVLRRDLVNTEKVISEIPYTEIVLPKKRGRKPKVATDNLPVTETVPLELEEVITKELARHNITEAILTEMEQNFLPLTINGVQDKEGYLVVDNARKAVKNLRVLGVKICKDNRAEAIRFQKKWIEAEAKFEERTKSIELALEAKQKEIDDIKEEEKRKREEREQVILQERAVKLIHMGMQLIDGAYVMNDIKISVTAAKNYDQFTWDTLVAGVENKWREKEEIRLEQERQKEIEAANLKRIAEENLAKQEALRKQEEELQARQKAIEDAEVKQKLEAERIIQEREQAEKNRVVAEQEAKRKATEELVKTRKSQLFQLGFSQQNNLLLFKELSISEEIIKTSDVDEWTATLEDLTIKSIIVKEQLEKDRLAEIDRIKEESATRERLRIETENAAKLKKEKENAEKLERERLLAEAEEKRLAELLPDVDKLNVYLKAISDVPMPEFSTKPFKDYSITMIATKNQFLTHIFKNKPL